MRSSHSWNKGQAAFVCEGEGMDRRIIFLTRNLTIALNAAQPFPGIEGARISCSSTLVPIFFSTILLTHHSNYVDFAFVHLLSAFSTYEKGRESEPRNKSTSKDHAVLISSNHFLTSQPPQNQPAPRVPMCRFCVISVLRVRVPSGSTI